MGVFKSLREIQLMEHIGGLSQSSVLAVCIELATYTCLYFLINIIKLTAIGDLMMKY